MTFTIDQDLMLVIISMISIYWIGVILQHVQSKIENEFNKMMMVIPFTLISVFPVMAIINRTC